MIWLMVAVGGAIGSAARFGVTRLAQTWLGPTSIMGTVFVNITGSFILGLFITLALERVPISNEWRAFVGTGILGGYTTFSTFSYEAAHLLQTGEMSQAAARDRKSTRLNSSH